MYCEHFGVDFVNCQTNVWLKVNTVLPVFIFITWFSLKLILTVKKLVTILI